MTNLEGNLDFFLDQGTALRLIYEKAEPYLWAMGFVEPIKDDKDEFSFAYNSAGMDADSKKKKPAHVRIGGDFPEIQMSRGSYDTRLKSARGFSVRIKHQTIRDEPKGIDEVQRAYKTAGYWFARFIQDEIVTALTAGVTSLSWSTSGVWSGAARPIDDLILLEEAMETAGYEYALTDALIHKTNFFELKRYLTGVDVDGTKLRDLYGVPVVHKDRMRIPVIDSDIIKCGSGISEGYILGLDRNNPAAEYHYLIDPQFGTAKVQYNTVVDGKKQLVTADNIGLHFDTWVEKGKEDTILKFWAEEAVVVTQPYAGRYGSGI
jgi:hypothetical protein